MSAARRVVRLGLITLLVSAAACSSDPVIPPLSLRVELRHDGDNVTAPNLPAATYEAAARFATANLPGGELVEVEFYTRSLPASAMLKIYGAGTPNAPGTLLYEADVTATLTPSAWQSHILSSPVTISGAELWIAIEFAHPGTQRTIGCDAGPAVPDGDWLYSSADGMWIPFNQRFSASVNWNIRGIVLV